MLEAASMVSKTRRVRFIRPLTFLPNLFHKKYYQYRSVMRLTEKPHMNKKIKTVNKRYEKTNLMTLIQYYSYYTALIYYVDGMYFIV